MFFINLLDPYSNFGKISVTFFQPLFYSINNVVNSILEGYYIYTLRPFDIKSLPFHVILVSSVIFLTIMVLSVWRGRLFCNTICPVGAALGLISEKSLYKIGFKDEVCTLCMRCERVCKAQCLDSKNKIVDMSRCVGCFNCFDACKNDGMYYQYRFENKETAKKPEAESQSAERRNFILSLTTATLALPALYGKRLLAQNNSSQAGAIPTGTKNPVTPPGSISYDHFTKNCIACYLCVSACPTNVIVPSLFDYGLEGFMQPKLDYHKSFCNFDCTRCTQVCPTGAITELSHKQKITTQIGIAKFMYESCIVVVDGNDCGACSEHCPTKAVDMLSYNGLWLPRVTPELCIGCGACEYACPTTPYKAIYVESNLVHDESIPIEEANGPRDHHVDDFPF